MSKKYFIKTLIAAMTMVLTGFLGLPVRTQASETVSLEMPLAGTGDTASDPIIAVMEEEIAVAENQGRYYSFEINEPGEYVLEGSMRSFSFFIHDDGGSLIAGNSYDSSGSITCSGEVVNISSAGTYSIFFQGTEAGTFSFKKADIPDIMVGTEVSAETRGNHILFYRFTPEKSGNYAFTFALDSGGGEVHRVGGRGTVSYGSACATTIYDKMEAGTTYYFMLKNDTSTFVTAYAEQIPGLVSVSAAEPLRSVVYLGLEGNFGMYCQYQLTLDSGDVISTNYFNIDMCDRYNLDSKTYTIDGRELPHGSSPSQVGEYYTVLTAEDLVSEPVYFSVRNPEDCNLVLRPGETISGLKSCGMGRGSDTYLIKLVLEEAGQYSLQTSSSQGGAEIYCSDLTYSNINGSGWGTWILNVDGPAVYYAYVGAEEPFDVTLSKMVGLSSLKVSENFKTVYINKGGNNSPISILRGVRLEGRTEENESIDVSYADRNWSKYGMHYDIYGRDDSGNLTQDSLPVYNDLPVGNYVFKISDRDNSISCNVEFSVIDYQDIPNVLILDQTVSQRYQQEYYRMDVAESASFYYDLDSVNTDCEMWVYDSEWGKKFSALRADAKFSLDAGRYYIRIRNKNTDASVDFTMRRSDTPPTESEEVRNQINGIVSETATAVRAMDRITASIEIERLCRSMQTDANVRAQIADLEQKYMKEKSVEITDPAVSSGMMGRDGISTVGLGLNAESGVVMLSVSDASPKVPVPSEKYENEVALEIKLLNDGREVEELQIPVTITLPVPTALSAKNLVILHYAEDGSIAETIYPDISMEKSITFTVTHFSTFVFVNEKDAGEEDNGKGSLTGRIKCVGAGNEQVTIQLIGTDGTVAAQTSVGNSDTAYGLDGVAPGTYTLRVSRPNYVSRDYTVTVGSKPIELDAEIWLKGDVNGDGRINAMDKRVLYNHMAAPALTGYEFAVGDVNGDGKINAADKRMIYNHISNTAPLW